jgi:hypothetical protein
MILRMTLARTFVNPPPAPHDILPHQQPWVGADLAVGDLRGSESKLPWHRSFGTSALVALARERGPGTVADALGRFRHCGYELLAQPE